MCGRGLPDPTAGHCGVLQDVMSLLGVQVKSQTAKLVNISVCPLLLVFSETSDTSCGSVFTADSDVEKDLSHSAIIIIIIIFFSICRCR